MTPPPLLDFLHRWTDTQIQHNKNNNKKEKITTLITTPIKARRGEPRRETRGEAEGGGGEGLDKRAHPDVLLHPGPIQKGSRDPVCGIPEGGVCSAP